ncbi:MAG: ribokinase [Oscillospiraceae bacterium]|nr:ribokinase [Oscillospiraceae bacterium]
MEKIFIFGSTAVDVSVKTDGDGSVFTTLGGKGSNQAVAAKRAGGDVTLASKIGGDSWGGFALDFWRRERLDHSASIVDDSANTGIAAVIIDGVGENRIIRGENPNRALTDTDAAFFASQLPERGIFLTQLSADVSVVLKLLRLAKNRGLTTILDTPYVKPPPEELWQYVDIITPNEQEAKRFGTAPVKRKVVTLGAKGVYVTDGVTERIIPPFAVEVADTTGAGDAFNGAFAALLAEGADIFEAARHGNAAGALCASKRGAAIAMPYRQEIEALIRGANL